MKKKIIYVILVILIVITGVILFFPKPTEKKTVSESVTRKEEKIIYTCPMHPSIIQDHPGACPICGMSLVKQVSKSDENDTGLTLLKKVSLSSTQRVLANITTTQAAVQEIGKEITTIGVVDFAEPLQMKITARFRGRIEKLYANSTGEPVKQDQPLFDLYSPDLISAEQELLLALNNQSDVGSSLYSSESEQRLIDAAKSKLRLTYGMTDVQLKLIDSTREILPRLSFLSPISGTVIAKSIQEGEYVDEGSILYQIANLSKVWVNLDIYEKDIQSLKLNQSVHITTNAYPEEMFTGTVTFIDPVLNPETRTIKVRTEFQNNRGLLKPQMWVNAHIMLPSKNSLVIPTSAILATGKQNLVWVEIGDNIFEPREVSIGVQSGGQSEILSGINEGESVVTTGSYLLDSESQLQNNSGETTSTPSDSSDNSMPGMNMEDKR